jgi:hypothetical protein
MDTSPSCTPSEIGRTAHDVSGVSGILWQRAGQQLSDAVKRPPSALQVIHAEGHNVDVKEHAPCSAGPSLRTVLSRLQQIFLLYNFSTRSSDCQSLHKKSISLSPNTNRPEGDTIVSNLGRIAQSSSWVKGLQHSSPASPSLPLPSRHSDPSSASEYPIPNKTPPNVDTQRSM